MVRKLLDWVLSHSLSRYLSDIQMRRFPGSYDAVLWLYPQAGAVTPANSHFAFLWNISPQHRQKKKKNLTLCTCQSEQTLQSVYFWLETWPRHPVFYTQTPNLRSTRLFSLWRSLINQEALWPLKEALSFPANTPGKKKKKLFSLSGLARENIEACG